MIYREFSLAAQRFRKSSQLSSAKIFHRSAQLITDSYFFQNLQLCLGPGSPRFEKSKRGHLTEMIISLLLSKNYFTNIFSLKKNAQRGVDNNNLFARHSNIKFFQSENRRLHYIQMPHYIQMLHYIQTRHLDIMKPWI